MPKLKFRGKQHQTRQFTDLSPDSSEEDARKPGKHQLFNQTTSPISISSSPGSSPVSQKVTGQATNDLEITHVKKNLLLDMENSNRNSCDYFMGDKTLPIFISGMKTGVFTKKILSDILWGDATLATRVPICVNKDALFLVDLTKIAHHRDILADGWGHWKQTSTKFHYYKVVKNTLQEIHENRYGEKNSIKVSRMSYRHSTSKDFHRVIIFVRKYDGQQEQMIEKAAVQYFFDGQEHNINVSAHGNSKRFKTSYQRTYQSVKDNIKSRIEEKEKPKEIVHNILGDKGGIQEIQAPGEHARNRKQISNFKYNSRSGRFEDPLLEVMDICKEQSKYPSTAFVREVTACPEMTVFLASEQQLLDIERFCTHPQNFSILGVDATFNLGPYYLTLTTYRHLMLRTDKNIHPVFLGPSIIHQRRTFDSYFSLPSNMVKLNPNLQRILAYGSDGEKSLTDAFDSCFINSVHLLCDIHMKDNIKSKLSNLGIRGKESNLYINEIFGKQVGTVKEPGLVDSFSKTEFQEKLNTLRPIWIERHEKGKEFLTYFNTYKADLITNSMTADLRALCGLGYPPSMYNQNANECANSVVKRDLNFEKLNVTECVEHLQVLVKRQFDECRLAMIGRGELDVDDSYQQYKISETRYYQMTKQQKEKLEQKFFSAKVHDICDREAEEPSEPSKQNYQLSISPEGSQIISIPFNIVEDIFNKAGTILSDPTNIVIAPGSSEKMYLVVNYHEADCPHHVRLIGNNQQLSCDKMCLRWVTYKICPHTLAVAEHISKLRGFLSWYNSHVKSPSYTSLANHGMPANRGKKSTKSTSRRKGGKPNKAKETIEEFSTLHSTPGPATTLHNTPGPSATLHNNPGSPTTLRNTPGPSTTLHNTPGLSTTLHNTPGPSNKDRLVKPSLPSPQAGAFTLTLLKWCHEKTTSCFGCKGKFKENGYPDAPSDFVVVSKGLREFTRTDGTRHSKLGNIYFHLNDSCIKKHTSFFVLCLLKIPEDVKPTLTEIHKVFLEKLNIPF